VSKIIGVFSAATAGIAVIPAAFGGTFTFQNGASNDFIDSYAGTQATTVEVITGNANDDANFGGQSNVRTQNSSGNRFRFIMSFDLSSLAPYASQLTVTGSSLNLTQAFVNSDASFSPLILNLFNANNAGWLQGTGTSLATTTGPWATGNALAAVTSSTSVVRWKNANGTAVGANTISGAGSSTGVYSVLYTQPGGTGYLDNAPVGTHDIVTPTGTAATAFNAAVQNWINNPSQNAGLYFSDNGGSTDAVEYLQDTNATIANRPALVLTLTSATMSTNYTDTTGDTWSDGTAWDNGSPNTIGATANFGNTITAPTTVTIDSPQVVSAINFDSANSYTIGGSSTLTLLEVNNNQATISVASGNHTISAPISDRTNTTFNVASGSTLAITGPFNAANKVITNSGGGTVQLPALVANTLNNAAGTMQTPSLTVSSLTISGGTVQIAQQSSSGNTSGVSVVNNLSVTGGKLDLTNNGLVVPFASTSTSPINAIAAAIAAGSITSSTSNPGHPTGIGYADSLDIGDIGSFLGVSFNTDAVVARYTLDGDTNLDGVVDSNDFSTLAANYGSVVTAGWDLGDFNNDGTVNALDFNYLATNFGAPLDPPLGAVAMGAQVPEPTTIGLISGIGALLSIRRRRRS
jgi:hypothetical protein